MKNLLIIGARGLGREVYDLAMDCIASGADFEIKGFLDDKTDALDGFEGYPPIIDSVEQYEIQPDDVFSCALGDPKWRRHYTEIVLAKGGKFVTLIGPKTIIRRNCHIGEGCIITNGSNISVDCYIGNYAAILDSSVAHDAMVGDFSVLSGKVCVNGGAEIGKDAYLGCNSLIVPHKKVGDGAFVGIGSVVLTSVKAGTKVYGNPAKRIDF